MCKLPRTRAGTRFNIMRRILPLFSALALAACAPPGQNTLAATPLKADAQTIQTADEFAGRLPLVTIQPGTTDFEPALKQAIEAALAIKPDAVFEVRAEIPHTGAPNQEAQALTALTPQAQAVATAIIADGVPATHVRLAAKAIGTSPAILVFVK